MHDQQYHHSPWRAAKQQLQLVKKTERETQPKGHSPHARDNQLQVGSIGDPIRPLVAELLIFTYRSAGGGEAAARLCGVVAGGGVDDEGRPARVKKKKKDTTGGGSSSEKGKGVIARRICMVLGSGGAMIWWRRCSTHGRREGEAAFVGWGSAHLVGCRVMCLCVCVCVCVWFFFSGRLAT